MINSSDSLISIEQELRKFDQLAIELNASVPLTHIIKKYNISLDNITSVFFITHTRAKFFTVPIYIKVLDILAELLFKAPITSAVLSGVNSFEALEVPFEKLEALLPISITTGILFLISAIISSYNLQRSTDQWNENYQRLILTAHTQIEIIYNLNILIESNLNESCNMITELTHSSIDIQDYDTLDKERLIKNFSASLSKDKNKEIASIIQNLQKNSSLYSLNPAKFETQSSSSDLKLMKFTNIFSNMINAFGTAGAIFGLLGMINLIYQSYQSSENPSPLITSIWATSLTIGSAFGFSAAMATYKACYTNRIEEKKKTLLNAINQEINEQKKLIHHLRIQYDALKNISSALSSLIVIHKIGNFLPLTDLKQEWKFFQKKGQELTSSKQEDELLIDSEEKDSLLGTMEQ